VTTWIEKSSRAAAASSPVIMREHNAALALILSLAGGDGASPIPSLPERERIGVRGRAGREEHVRE
jgi:hypothetical protein